MSIKIEDMIEPARSHAEAAIAELKSIGVKFAVTYTLRTTAEQSALFAQGRQPLDVVNSLRDLAKLPALPVSENAYTVTKCDGITKRSPHQSGKAIDIVPIENGRPIWPALTDPRWKSIAEVMKKHGFTWGGDWKDFPDYPHYQFGA